MLRSTNDDSRIGQGAQRAVPGKKLGGCAKAHPPKEKLQSLEDDLHCELHVELLARAKAGSAVEVADGVTHQTESGARVAGGARRCCPATTAHRPWS